MILVVIIFIHIECMYRWYFENIALGDEHTDSLSHLNWKLCRQNYKKHMIWQCFLNTHTYKVAGMSVNGAQEEEEDD